MYLIGFRPLQCAYRRNPQHWRNSLKKNNSKTKEGIWLKKVGNWLKRRKTENKRKKKTREKKWNSKRRKEYVHSICIRSCAMTQHTYTLIQTLLWCIHELILWGSTINYSLHSIFRCISCLQLLILFPYIGCLPFNEERS